MLETLAAWARTEQRIGCVRPDAAKQRQAEFFPSSENQIVLPGRAGGMGATAVECAPLFFLATPCMQMDTA